MKDLLRLIDNEKIIRMKVLDFFNISSEKEKLTYVSANTAIEINPMRLENIMFHITVPAELENLPDIHVHFLTKQDGSGSNSNNIFHLKDLPFQISKDKRKKRIMVTDTGHWTLGGLLEVKYLGFSFGYELPNIDFGFTVDVYQKWTYVICNDSLNTEFWFPDGRRHHEIGDNFSYNNKVELSVRDQDEKYTILYCSTMGII